MNSNLDDERVDCIFNFVATFAIVLIILLILITFTGFCIIWEN